MAGIASFRQAFIGLIELTPVLEFDGIVEQRQRLGYGCIDQIGYRQALPARDRLRYDCKALPEFLKHVARERPVLGVPSQPKLGVARLDQHTHEGAHLWIER